MQESVWLVEIALKSWEPDLPGHGRTVTYEEVLATEELSARQAAWEQFISRAEYEPVLRRHLLQFGITPHNCCAFEAVVISGLEEITAAA
jgi:hypothetical protein